MVNLTVDIVKIEERIIYGIWKESNDKKISTDIDTLSENYYLVTSQAKGSVLPYFVLSRNYDEQSRNFEMFIGSTFEKNDLDKVVLPAGEYAKITVKPKLGFLWGGGSIGEAKRYFYTKWLQENSYLGLNMEYEFHTEKSKNKHPTIDIIFAIQRKV